MFNNVPSWLYRELAWAWLIIIGGIILITPGGVICLSCGPIERLAGIISILIGVIGFAAGRTQAPATR